VGFVGVDAIGFGLLLEHLLVKPLEETLATRQPLTTRPTVRAELVAHADTLVPVDDLLEFNPDLLGHFVCEIPSERVEFDFLLEFTSQFSIVSW
jgi:hypothetical protein